MTATTGAELIARGRIIAGSAVVDGEVWADQGVIVEIRPRSEVPEQWVCPGFIDLQINGSHGIDVSAEPARVHELARLLPAEGVTAFCPTVITGPDDVRRSALGRIPSDGSPASSVSPGSAVPLGFHLEGPVIARTRRGAHPECHLRTPADVADEPWRRDAGVAMVTLAPELPGVDRLIEQLRAASVTVAIGHTDATADLVARAVELGATHVTHLFNAMRPFGHRDPGPIGAVLGGDDLTAGLICDLVHVDPLAIAMAWRALGPHRLVLVTDAVAARGTIAASDAAADGVRTADGTLAGSALRLDDAVRTLVAVTGCAVTDAVRTVTATPAEVLGLSDRGVLQPGARADLTVLDPALRVVDVYVGGVPVGIGPPTRTR